MSIAAPHCRSLGISGTRQYVAGMDIVMIDVYSCRSLKPQILGAQQLKYHTSNVRMAK